MSRALEALIKGARATGELNFSNKNLKALPRELDEWFENPGDTNWWEVCELTKLDISHNGFEHLEPKTFESLSDLRTLHCGHNQITDLPLSVYTSSSGLIRLSVQYNRLGTIHPAVECLTGLLELQADHNVLATLPDEITAVTLLETLDVSFNKLRQLPDEIGRLERLQRLCVAGNGLRGVPGSLSRMRGLRELELSKNALTSLPSLANMASLTRLDCRENQLSDPPHLPATPALFEVLLGFNRLTSLPLGLQATPKLSVLELADNKLASLNEPDLLCLRELRRLDLRNNDLRDLPSRLGNMTCIVALNFEGNPSKTLRRGLLEKGTREILSYLRSRIQDGDEEIAAAKANTLGEALRGMRFQRELLLAGTGITNVPMDLLMEDCALQVTLVDLSSNRLDTLPPEFARLGAATTLTLSDNAFRTLPTSVAHMPSLATLVVSHNSLAQLPPMTGMRALITLDLSRNGLKAVPEVLCRDPPPCLQDLFLGFNQLRTLPPSIGAISSLRLIDAQSNKIDSLPEQLLQLEMLASLNLSNNNLSSLPTWLGNANLRALLVDGNPLRLIRRDVIANTTALLKFLQEKQPLPPPEQPAAAAQGGGGDEAHRLQAEMQTSRDKIAALDAEMSSGGKSVAVTFALKKKIQMERSVLIRLERQLKAL